MSTFRFRKKTDYGLMLMTILAREGRGEVVSAKTMQELGLPRSFLVKIAKELIKAGMVGAKEGRGGGYYLKKESKKISLRQLVETLEGKVCSTACVMGNYHCPMEGECQHSEVMKKLSGEIEEVLEKYSLDELVRHK
ncbi:MAG: Rrf2 family transcriptional regulator [bacterium]